jgi:hypothetical protein
LLRRSNTLLCFCLAGAATFWVAEIRQPGAAVELCKGGPDLTPPADLEDVDALNLLVVVASTVDRDPAPANLVAAVEDIEGLEVEWGL